MRANLLDPDCPDPIDRRPQSDRLGDLRCPGLELPRQVGPRRFIGSDGADHVTAADERRHLLQQHPAPVKHADPGRAVGLVAGPRVEVSVELAQVDRQLWHRLGAVDQHDRTGVMGAPGDLGDRVDRPDDVGHVNHSHELWTARQQRVVCIEVELPIGEHRHVREFGAAVLTEQLPRDDV